MTQTICSCRFPPPSLDNGTSLLKHIETPGLDIAILMREVRQDVIASTSGRQVPWDNSSLTTDFEFNSAEVAVRPSASPALSKVAALPASTTPNEAAQTEWPAWIKLCLNNETTGNKQICLINYEGLDPSTGAVLVAAAVRIDSENKQMLLVRVPTTNSLSVQPGLQITIDDDNLKPLPSEAQSGGGNVPINLLCKVGADTIED